MAAPKAHFSVGIAGLPNPARTMVPGKTYAVNVRTHAAMSCQDNSIAEALRDQRSVIAVIRTPAAELLQRLAFHGIRTDEVLKQGRLQILERTGEASEKLLVHGARHFTDELDFFTLPKNTLLVLENAEDLFTLSDVHLASEQARIYQQWAQSANVTVMLFFSVARVEASQIASLRTLSDLFAGVAEFAQAGIQFSWHINHWQSPFASISHREYAVSFDAEGIRLLAAGYQLEGLDAQIKNAPDQGRVIATETVVHGERGVPSHWRIVKDLDELLEAAEGAIAATCLIDFINGDKLHVLARAVHHLRQKHGPGLRIIVRERKLRLRYSDELLLLRLGANTVVYAEVNFSRLISLIESLREHIYSGDVPDHFEAAVHAAMPPPHMGYLKPIEFCEMVRDSLAQSARLGIESTLAYLALLPEISHVDALRLFNIKRRGDLITADHRGIWIFLYACREPDVDATLERLHTHPLAQTFEGQIRYFSSVSIQSAIDKLESSLYNMPIADFSAQMENTAPVSLSRQKDTSELIISEPTSAVLGQIETEERTAPLVERRVMRAHLPLRHAGEAQ